MNPNHYLSYVRSKVRRYTVGLIGLCMLCACAPALAVVTFANGDVFVAINNSQIQWRHNDGTFVGTLTVPSTAATVNGANTAGMAFDSAGKLYVAMFQSQTVAVFDNTGTFLHTFGSGYNSDPESICFDAAGNAYVGQADGTHRFLKFSPSGTLLSSFLPTTEDRGTDWVDISGNQCTMYYTSEGSNVLAFNVCTATQSPKLTTILPGTAAYEHRLLPNGETLVADTEGVIRLSSAGAVVQTYNYNVTNNFFAVSLDPDGTSFWTADIVNFFVYKFDIASGAVLLKFRVIPNSVVSGIVVKGGFTAGTAILRMTKSCPGTNGIPGGVIGFTGTITNTGSVTVTNIVIVNNQPTNNTPVVVIPSLAPGQGTNFAGVEPVPTNVCIMPDRLSATGVDTNGNQVTTEASANCSVTTTPALSLVKQCPGTNVMPGGVVGWSASVTNVGDVSITNIVIVNNTNNETSGRSDVIYLSPGAQASVQDVMVPEGTPIALSNIVVTESSNEYVPAFFGPVPTPDGAVVFLESAGSTNISDVIWVHNQFFYFASDPSITNFPPGIPIIATLVENGGIQDVSPFFALPPFTVAVQSDVEAPPSTVLIIPRLDPGQGATFGGQEVAPTNACSVSDTLTVTGRDICGNVVTTNATAVCPIQTSPGLFIEKFCVGTNVPGGTLSWFGFVQNTGNVPITNVVVVNNQPSNDTPVITLPILLPGQSTNFGGSYPIPPVTCANGACSISDTLTATGTTVCGDPVSASTNHVCPLITHAGIQVAHDSGASNFCAGSVATFSGQVVNTGDVPLVGVTLLDVIQDANSNVVSQTTLTNIACLDPGATQAWTSAYQTVPADCTRGPLQETVYVSGTNLCDGPILTQMSQYTFMVQCPQVCLTKGIGCVMPLPTQEPQPQAVVGGGVILVCASSQEVLPKEVFGVKSDTQDPAFCYQLTVTNCGGCSLVNLSLTDEQLGLTNFAIGPLDPGGSFFTNIFKALSETTTNVALVTGQSASDSTTNGAVSSTDVAIAHVRTAGISVTKLVSVNGSTPAISFVQTNCGEIATNITWYAVVTNTGEADLENVVLTDSLIAGDGLPCTNISIAVTNLAVGVSSDLIPVCSIGFSNCVATNLNNFLEVTATAAPEGSNCVWDITGTNVSVSAQTNATLSLCCPAAVTMACRVTGGGKQDAGMCPDARFTTHGGQVGAPISQAVCSLGTNVAELLEGNPCIRGRWSHVRHGGVEGNFHARFFDTLGCACLGGGFADTNGLYTLGVVTNGLCDPGDGSVGPQPPSAPGNKIAFTGVGDWFDPSVGRRPTVALFRVDVEDRGQGHRQKGVPQSSPDRYRIRIWILTPDEHTQLLGVGADPYLVSFRTAISACNGLDYQDGVFSVNLVNSCDVTKLLLFPGANNPVRQPDIDDGGELRLGNEQIHPAVRTCEPSP